MTYLELGRIVYGEDVDIVNDRCPSYCFQGAKEMKESDLEDKTCIFFGDGTLICEQCWNREIEN